MPPDEYLLQDAEQRIPPAPATGPLSAPLNPASAGTRPSHLANSRVSDFWALMGCNAIVFGASVCIMVLELTASRLIAVHQGQSLYTWTSVIGVVLAGISVGNYLGGWLADRFPPRKVLGWLFLSSGMFTFSVLWLNQWAAGAQRRDWSLQGWVIFVVAWIFFLPALSLGTISPVTASIALTRSTRTGMTVGNVYAWGAVGSIVGTFLTGFYLVDVLGTKTIVVCTALALLAMGLLVAGGQWAFRALVLFGAMQFVIAVGLCAASDEEKLAFAGEKLGVACGWFKAPSERPRSAKEWAEWGRQFGRNLHELGLLLALRDDRRGEYNDESNYYAINVAVNNEDGETFKELKLDHLLHSYYNSDNPTKLYYDYERVYAAITERSAGEWNRTTEVELREPPTDQLGVALPPEMKYDTGSKRLSIRGAMNMDQFRQLVALGPDGEYWQAILQTWEKSNEAAITFFATPLERLPEGIVFPKRLAEQIYWDASLQAIICNRPIDFDDAVELMALSKRGAYIGALVDLLRRSRRVTTLFIGGGGFVFPRWIESKFPYQPVIDVAEIDPAVKLAAQKELGLPPDGETSVRTHIGDARRFIDDRREQNAALASEGRPGVLYDFIYGDAFNDYSVPWHLTTLEFSRKIKDMLTPGEGLYLVNIIDIYPRTEYPPRDLKVGFGETVYNGPLPEGLLARGRQPHQWVAAPRPFQQLETNEQDAGAKCLMRYNRPMSTETRNALRELVGRNGKDGSENFKESKIGAFREAVRDLYAQTNARVFYKGNPPAALVPPNLSRLTWGAVPGFENFEINRHEKGYSLGFRGVMTADVLDRLIQVAPQDAELQAAARSLYEKSHQERTGQFLGRYVNTVRQVFPFVYLFGSDEDGPGDDRDTFVVACSLKTLNLDELERSGGYWKGAPFAWMEEGTSGGQMRAVLEAARGQTLTDDFAPVDNLLAPVFVRQ